MTDTDLSRSHFYVYVFFRRTCSVRNCESAS